MDKIPYPTCGIYYLYDGDGLLYVGRSRNIERRLWFHARAGKKKIVFTHYSVMRCPPNELPRRELEEVVRLKPPLNKQLSDTYHFPPNEQRRVKDLSRVRKWRVNNRWSYNRYQRDLMRARRARAKAQDQAGQALAA